MSTGMRFSELKPSLGSSAHFRADRPVWQLSFECPKCRNRTEVLVSHTTLGHPVWLMRPAPLLIFADLNTTEPIEDQMVRAWDRVTIEPSMQQLPHARQIACDAHFSVIEGKVIQ